MLVKIGKYKNWVGPYQLAEALCFWAKEVPDEHGFKDKPEWVHKFGEWLAYGSVKPDIRLSEVTSWDDERSETLLCKFLSWIYSKRERKIKVRIDPWDTWGMDNTLAYIALPMLKQLKEQKHGSPNVDDNDVPEELKSTSAPATENDWGTDDNHHKRWDWVMDQMIFAFESQFNEWEEQFHTGIRDIQWKKLEGDYNEMIKGPNDTSYFDSDGHLAYQTRISNGFRLFGKYFESLWD